MKPTSRKFRQAKWDEPIIMEMSVPGERGILLPGISQKIESIAGDVVSIIPEAIRRKVPPALPEISQARVVRHFTHLSQETLGTDVSIDIGKGTCTMKYSPKVNEHLARLSEAADIHPLQDESTIQGTLQIMYDFQEILKEISGMDEFSLQPGGGSQAIYTNACIIRAYHEQNGESQQRNEIITTVFSHPVNAACARTAGFKVITLYPGVDGYPDLDALRRVVSDRTAGMMITNPEDSGIFNPKIQEFVDLVHEAGGICSYDQANANGILGITRAREAGFDLCHFNLHKSFSSPHGSGGPGSGVIGATSRVAKYLPVPVVEFDGIDYRLNYDRPFSIGKIREFHGCFQVVLRAYAWVMSMGAEGLREVAEIATANNNYVLKKMKEIRGVEVPYDHKRRIEQVRYSLEKMKRETGVGTDDVRRRVTDFGTHYWTSHHPWVVAEPFTLEPTESYSTVELDEYVGILRKVSEEAYRDPNLVIDSPRNGIIQRVDESSLDDPSRWAVTWRAHLRKNAEGRSGRQCKASSR